MAGKRQRSIDLEGESGPPLTTGDLARITGLSLKTIHRDIAAGELKACRRARRSYRLINWHEAKRYVLSIGVIQVPRET